MRQFRLILMATLALFLVLFLFIGDFLIHMTNTSTFVPLILCVLTGVTFFMGYYLVFRRDTLSK